MGRKIILTVDAIKKQFSSVTAVDAVSFSILEGEIFALLGPNGAGKTTTVRMLTNIMQPDSGTITYAIDGTESSVLQPSLLGYLPEERGLYQEVTIINTLTYMGVIRGMGRKNAIFAANKWLEQLGLLDRSTEKLNTLSKGNQQKIQFIASIIHQPKFAILDEPFSGLDPINQELLLKIMKELTAKGTTVLLSAHQMHLVEKIADRVLLLNKGKAIAYGSINEVIASSTEGNVVVLEFEQVLPQGAFQQVPSVLKVEMVHEKKARIFLKSEDLLSPFLYEAAGRYKLTNVSTEKCSLHDAFISRIQSEGEVEHAK